MYRRFACLVVRPPTDLNAVRRSLRFAYPRTLPCFAFLAYGITSLLCLALPLKLSKAWRPFLCPVALSKRPKRQRLSPLARCTLREKTFDHRTDPTTNGWTKDQTPTLLLCNGPFVERISPLVLRRSNYTHDQPLLMERRTAPYEPPMKQTSSTVSDRTTH